jgi:hypothetical protein
VSLRAALGWIALAALAAPSVADARDKSKGRRRGKVVRVERSTHARTQPLACSMYYGSGTCYGQEILVGTIASVVDEKGVRAEVRVKEVTPQPDRCGNPTGWSFTVDTLSGDVNAPGQIWLVIDLPIHGLRTMQPGTWQVPTGKQENAWAAFDSQGDGTADYMVTWHNCDVTGMLQQNPSDPSFCMNYYEYRSGDYVLIKQDNVRSCG